MLHYFFIFAIIKSYTLRNHLMIIYNEELGDKDCEVNPDSTTKRFLVAFFGFYRHDIAEDFNEFLKELEFDDMLDHGKDLNNFKLDGKFGLEAYNCYDRRTFDVTIVVPKTFISEQSALDWFSAKIKESDHIKKSEICEIGVIDADKLLLCIKTRIDYATKVKSIEDAFKSNIQALKQKMLDDFKHDSDYAAIIDKNFRQIKNGF